METVSKNNTKLGNLSLAEASIGTSLRERIAPTPVQQGIGELLPGYDCPRPLAAHYVRDALEHDLRNHVASHEQQGAADRIDPQRGGGSSACWKLVLVFGFLSYLEKETNGFKENLAPTSRTIQREDRRVGRFGFLTFETGLVSPSQFV